MKTLRERDITALIFLLDDEDQEVLSRVRAELVGAGKKVLAPLEEAASTADPSVRERIRNIVDEICLGPLPAQFRRMRVEPNGDLDLEEGVALIVRCEYPDLDWGPYLAELDGIAAALRSPLLGAEDPEQSIELVSEYLFDECGFEGVAMVSDPEDCYLNRVLDRRRGIPISMAAVYLLLARRLGLAMRGVGLPGRFVCRLETGDGALYFDPVEGGTILSYHDCVRLCTRAGYGFHDAFLAPTTERLILERMFNNLINLYRAVGDRTRAKRMADYLALMRDRH